MFAAILVITCGACVITCCNSEDDNPMVVAEQAFVPKAPDYSDPTMWVTKDLINVGDIHSCEPWLYSECLAKNIAVRTAEWRKQEYE